MTQPNRIDIGEAADADLPALLAIYNHAVRETTAAWTSDEVDLDNRRRWLADKRQKGLPVLVARLDGVAAGFATYGSFRDWPGYLWTVENSVYVRLDVHRRGLGRRLLEALIDRARGQGLHVMIAAIEAGNAPSIALHARLGFQEAGRLAQVGAKFGRWLDLVLMRLDLNDDGAPP
jgi:phosphinothricin acetyltransferase